MVSEAISEIALLAVGLVFLSVVVAYAGNIITPPTHAIFDVFYDGGHLKIINLNGDVIYLNKIKIILLKDDQILIIKGVYNTTTRTLYFIDTQGRVYGTYDKAIMDFGDCIDLDLSRINLRSGLYFVNVVYNSKCFTTSINV